MIRAILSSLLLLPVLHIAAQDQSDPAQRYLEEFLPYCSENPTVSQQDFSHAAPKGMKADLMKVESENPVCGGTFLMVRRDDEIYVGQPWLLSLYEGTIPEKVKQFAWERLHESALGTVMEQKTGQGLLSARVEIVTNWGKVKLHGSVDPDGRMFFPGGFAPLADGARKTRLDLMEPVLEQAPRMGLSDAKVQLIEFSDFQCPSCRFASQWVPKLVEKYGDRITYWRVDYPLMSSHPWAFAAALYGRAIWEQSPEAFWQYKSEVYQSQTSLTTFSIEEFARDFVQTNGLDVAAFDAAIASDALKGEILSSVGAGMMAEVNSTPTFWVNGQPVSPGPDGEYLMTVLDAALEQTMARETP